MTKLSDVTARRKGWNQKVNTIEVESDDGESVSASYLSPSIDAMFLVQKASEFVDSQDYSGLTKAVGEFLLGILCNENGVLLYDDYQALYDDGYGDPVSYTLFQAIAMAIISNAMDTKKKPKAKKQVRKQLASVE